MSARNKVIMFQLLCRLLPSDPVKRAQIRFAIEFYASKVTSAWYGFLRDFKKENLKNYLDALDAAYARVSFLYYEKKK